ncbi:MAG: N-formylglutamate deformylase [Epsilonproteobacteria bacterium]|nr:MAG: N-formylglutamate deformylase [Campylobacterota bacterium]RLA67652.1 MAG: N-formylglutamate deformylase [Campylobacterota bacterium]
MDHIYAIKKPLGKRLPILLSSPHSGVNFPAEIIKSFKQDIIDHPLDTDWFIDRLYDFAPTMGITQISANYSRYVVDLNRDFKGEGLYHDGRFLTGVVPSHSFSKTPLYKDGPPTSDEIKNRLQKYFWPYYKKVEELLADIKKEFGYAIFFDCHSIKRNVSSISEHSFPDLILGDNDGKTADSKLIDVTLETLGARKIFEVYHNTPFKGGHLTRWFGKPEEGIHALQLEMSQDLYLDESNDHYMELRAALIRDRLKETLINLAKEKL